MRGDLGQDDRRKTKRKSQQSRARVAGPPPSPLRREKIFATTVTARIKDRSSSSTHCAQVGIIIVVPSHIVVVFVTSITTMRKIDILLVYLEYCITVVVPSPTFIIIYFIIALEYFRPPRDGMISRT